MKNKNNYNPPSKDISSKDIASNFAGNNYIPPKIYIPSSSDVSNIANSLSNMGEAALNTVNTGVSAIKETVNTGVLSLKEIAISAINCRNQYNLIAGEVEKARIDANTSLKKINKIYKVKKEALNSLKSQVYGQLSILEQIDINNLDDKKIEVYKTVTQSLMFLADKICNLCCNMD